MTGTAVSATAQLLTKIAAFEQAAADASDSRIMARKISEKSDRTKYAFADGLRRDLEKTRSALKACASSASNGASCSCTFGELYAFTEGRIANLNKILQNLRKAKEVRFKPECFFDGVHDDEAIELLDYFWKEAYAVNERNVFRPSRNALVKDTPQDKRRGRSYFEENEKTRHVRHCSVCRERVSAEERITIRACVFHMKCISCAMCTARLRQKADYITFDGQICCGADCIRQYDAAHRYQTRQF
jgi:hypothetical protein